MRQNGNDPNDNQEEVSDEENYTDKKVKKRLLDSRDLLKQSENELETARLIEPEVEYTDYEATAAWAKLVQSFIRDLNILLENDDVPKAEHYREEVDLGSVELVPQDVEGIPFSKIVYDDISEDDIIMQSRQLDRGANLPRPHKVEFNGLIELAKADVVLERQWSVITNPRAARPNQNIVTTGDRKPIPKRIFQQALMEADQFLQGAGIGLDLSDSGVPDFGFEEVHEDE